MGDCVVSEHRDPAGDGYGLVIERADPVVLISDGILRDVLDNDDPERAATLTLADIVPADDIYLGAVLRIAGINQTVIYRITRRWDDHTHVGEWPD